MADLHASVDEIAADTDFSGVVRVDVDGATELAKAYGDAHRALGVPNTLETRFGTASGTKGLTALTVVSLIEDGSLTLDTTARSLLGDDLPLIADDVTVGTLLDHTSGIGDYLDEEVEGGDFNDYVLTIPVHRLTSTRDYLEVLDGYPTKFPAGERFSYCNGGFVVLALLAERAAGVAYTELVAERVCRPAGMRSTAFLRSDELPGDAAMGYLDAAAPRTNVHHLPVVGSGDGGIYTTVGDVHALWRAFVAGNVVSPPWVTEMTRPRHDVPSEGLRYGLGFWLRPTGDAIVLQGADAGVSFFSVHDPVSATTHTVLSNTTDGAWPLARHLRDVLV